MRAALKCHNPLTIREVVERLRLTHMTLHSWRRGTLNLPPLPARVLSRPRHRVQIDENDLIAWLSRNRPELAKQWHSP